jgi:hypothetical protein
VVEKLVRGARAHVIVTNEKITVCCRYDRQPCPCRYLLCVLIEWRRDEAQREHEVLSKKVMMGAVSLKNQIKLDVTLLFECYETSQMNDSIIFNVLIILNRSSPCFVSVLSFFWKYVIFSGDRRNNTVRCSVISKCLRNTAL